MSTDTQDLPSYVRPELEAVTPQLQLMSDLLGGTPAMQAKTSTYIRKWTDEDDAVYAIRSKCEEVYEGLARVLSAAVGMLFARPPKIEWNRGTDIEADWSNIDGQGNAGHVFVKRFAEMAVRDGLAAIMVDHAPQPTEPGLVVHSGNEAALGLQPQWSAYSRLSSLSWIVDAEGGRSKLAQVVFHEPTAMRYGVYGVKTVDRYRVLRLLDGQASWTLYERKASSIPTTVVKPDDFAVVRAGLFRNRAGAVADFLPVAVAYAGRSDAPFTSSIPLLGVAYKNLGHWQVSTDLKFASSVASYAQPVVIGDLVNPNPTTGVTQAKLKLGPLAGIHLQLNPTGPPPDFKWVAPPTEAFSQLEKNIEVKERHMGQLGMSFLTPQKRQQETATAERLDATAENASLSTAAQGIDDAVNLALEFHGWYRGIEKAGAPTFEINRDFENQAMDPQTMAVYVQAVRDAGLPPRLLLEAWQAGGRIPPDADLDEIEMQMLGFKAAEEQAARDAVDVQIAAAGAVAPQQAAA